MVFFISLVRSMDAASGWLPLSLPPHHGSPKLGVEVSTVGKTHKYSFCVFLVPFCVSRLCATHDSMVPMG